VLDNDTLQSSGSPVTVATDLSDFAASRDVLAYRSGRNAGAISQLQWFDRRGSKLATLGEPNAPGDVFLSRDGKTVMIDRLDSSVTRVWLGDTARGVFTRLTSAIGNETAGALTPDGGVVLTMTGSGSIGDLYIVRPNSATPELLTTSPQVKHPNDVSPDGKYLIYDEHGRQAQDLWILPLSAGGNAKPIPFLATSADETFGQFSPDGKWVAYMSTESGRPEVYVRAFLPDQNPAGGGRKWIVSTAGGNKPRWSRDGKELFYLAPDEKMMATPVKTGETFEPGIPVALFDVQVTGYFPYDVSPDGRFLINTAITSGQAATSSINVIVNWSSILRRSD
jgi:Tol biopolymer transport system component